MMNTHSEDSNTGLEVVYRLLCLPYFLLIGLYWLGYLYTPYMSYAVWKAHAIFMNSSESASSAVAEILQAYLAPLAFWLAFLKLSTTAYAWAILSPLRVRLYNAVNSPRKTRAIVEYSILAAFLISPVIIAHYRHNAFGLLSNGPWDSNSALSLTNDSSSNGRNKDLKRMSTVAVDKIRVASTKLLEMMSLAETLRSRLTVESADDKTRFRSLQKDIVQAVQEADSAVEELRKLVRESKVDRYWPFLLVLDRHMYLCERSLKLWILSLNARDQTHEDSIENLRKMNVECMAIRKLTNKKDSEACRKMDAACEAIRDLAGEKDSGDRNKMDAAFKTIREGCFEVVKCGLYISDRYQITD